VPTTKADDHVRIGLTGVPGAGKTSTGRALAAACRKDPEFNSVELCAEYARRYIEKTGTVESILEQHLILNKQLDWERTISNSKYVISDSPLPLVFLYSTTLPLKNAKEIKFMSNIYSELLKLNNPVPFYDFIFHIDPTVAPVDDGIRLPHQLDDTWRQDFNSQIKFVFQHLFPPKKFVVVPYEAQEDRVAFIMETMRTGTQ
jgi:AAA domain